MIEDQYQAALTRAGYFSQALAGHLLLRGPDRLAFLQRQTTQDAGGLKPGQAVLTVLTSPAARIADVFYLLAFPDEENDSLEVLSLAGHSSQTAGYLKSRIFFNDNVTLLDQTSQTRQLDLFGPAAEAVLQALGLPVPDLVGGYLLGTASEVQVGVLKHDPSIGLGYRLLVSSSGAESLTRALAASGVVEISPETYAVLRVERGLPAPEAELSEAYTPLEVGLGGAISHSKGCYTGQEVIARQVNYDKVTRQLAGLSLPAPVPSGTSVMIEGRPVGTVTSAVLSPRFGPIALAVLKRPHFQPGTAVQLQAGGQEMQAEVKSVPYE
jgi:tRNA-modifying protein YgfZ